MNALEKLGLEVAGARWLRVRAAESRLLAVFLTAGPDAVLASDVLDVRIRAPGDSWRDERSVDDGAGRVRVRVHRLRDALADVGFAASIENVRGVGYRMAATTRDAIRAALEASL